MNKEAIQEIQNTALASKVLEISNKKVVAVPDNAMLKSLERYEECRYGFRGILETTSIADWFAYVDKKGNEQSTVFIDKDSLSAKAIIDLGDSDYPLHCDHKAILTLEKTPIFEAVSCANEKAFNQSQMAEWLEDWNEHLTILDKDEEEMKLSEATAAIRRIEIKSSSSADFEVEESSAKLSRSEQIEAASKGKQVHSLRLTCVPFEGLDPVQLEIRLIVLAGDTPKIRFRVLRYAETKEQIAQNFKDKISTNIKESIDVYVGNFSE